MFSAFGSMISDDMENGLIETFEAHGNNKAKKANGAKTTCNATEVCEKRGSEKWCRMKCKEPFVGDESDSESSDSSSDDEEKDAQDEDQRENDKVNHFFGGNEPTKTTPGEGSKLSEDSQGSLEYDPEDEPTLTTPATSSSVNDETVDEDDVTPTFENTSKTEPFQGSMETFANRNELAQKATSINVVLKSVLFACLFYILAHNDSRDFVVKTLFKSVKAVKNDHYIYIAMVLFFIVCYVISIFL